MKSQKKLLKHIVVLQRFGDWVNLTELLKQHKELTEEHVEELIERGDIVLREGSEVRKLKSNDVFGKVAPHVMVRRKTWDEALRWNRLDSETRLISIAASIVLSYLIWKMFFS